jgi:hypothetical protein
MGYFSLNFQKMSKANNHTMGQNSLNLVTLEPRNRKDSSVRKKAKFDVFGMEIFCHLPIIDFFVDYFWASVSLD